MGGGGWEGRRKGGSGNGVSYGKLEKQTVLKKQLKRHKKLISTGEIDSSQRLKDLRVVLVYVGCQLECIKNCLNTEEEAYSEFDCGR